MLDFLTLRNALIGGGIGIVVLLTLIQITPIKLNPLSYIARKLGDALNASQSEKLESFKKQLEALDKKVEDLKNHVAENEIKATRIKILRFADEIFMGKIHSYDAYKEVLHAINEYQLYCNEHPDFVNNMVLKIIVKYINNGVDFLHDYKSELQELVQTVKKSVVYEIIDEQGPAHDKTFTCQVRVDDIIMGKGIGSSKKQAEQMAAKMALSKQVK